MGSSNKTWTRELPFFPTQELACKHCGSVRLNLDFAAALIALRYAWDGPLNPTSVCRCPEHNKIVGGHPRSLHLTINPAHKTFGTAAVDIFWANWPASKQLKFCKLAWRLGFSIGLNRDFCHLDLRAGFLNSKMLQIIFHYDNWDTPFLDSAITRD